MGHHNMASERAPAFGVFLLLGALYTSTCVGDFWPSAHGLSFLTPKHTITTENYLFSQRPYALGILLQEFHVKAADIQIYRSAVTVPWLLARRRLCGKGPNEICKEEDLCGFPLRNLGVGWILTFQDFWLPVSHRFHKLKGVFGVAYWHGARGRLCSGISILQANVAFTSFQYGFFSACITLRFLWPEVYFRDKSLVLE